MPPLIIRFKCKFVVIALALNGEVSKPAKRRQHAARRKMDREIDGWLWGRDDFVQAKHLGTS